MGEYIAVIIFAIGLFLAMLLLLAAKPKLARILTVIFAVQSVVMGMLFYGYGFLALTDNLFIAIIRALLAVCSMFVGEMDLSIVDDVPLLQQTWAQILLYLTHLLALYVTASAAVLTFGAEALRKLRLWLARRGRLNLIYGISPESVALGKDLLEQKKGPVVYVESNPDTALAETIQKAGCVLRSDESALKADIKFVKAIGAHRKSRDVTLYALESDNADSLRYARSLMKTLEDSGVTPEQTSLVIRGQEESAVTALQVLGNKYGYGFVTVFQEEQLAARVLMQQHPPCNYISFDEYGKATEDFEVLLVGFGQIGQGVLRSLVMNGQFEGSNFHATVFSPDCQTVDGQFLSCFETLLEKYSITFCPYDARSRKMYEFIRANGKKLKYVAICAGSEKANLEIADGLQAYFERMDLKIPVHMCTRKGVRSFDADGLLTRQIKLYQPSLLSSTEQDKMAMILNHYYMGEYGKNPLADWLKCDYFSRMSCRAATDFIHAMLRIAGQTEEDVAENGWNLTPEQLDNMSRTEHLRWCAFHYCMGFSTMSDDEFRQRADTYRRQLEEEGKATIRIGKNMAGRTHACLVDWEELEVLSQKEEEVTGKRTDYMAMDTANILAIPELLRTNRNLKL